MSPQLTGQSTCGVLHAGSGRPVLAPGSDCRPARCLSSSQERKALRQGGERWPSRPSGQLRRGHAAQSRWRRQVPARSQPEAAGGHAAPRSAGGAGRGCSLAGLLLS